MRKVRQQIGGLGNLMFKQAYLVGELLRGKIPDLYVQGTRYWSEYKNEVRAFFQEGIGYTDKVALHIRRGDYLKADHFHIDLSKTDYYQKAIEYFPNDNFLVFCKDNQGKDQDARDRVWVAEFLSKILPENKWEFAPFENSETDDMNLMASCKSIIMANSTFSWWAAFLNPNKEKRIICPKVWFADGIQRCELLEEWIKI